MSAEPLKLHNTLTGKKEAFKSLKSGVAQIYCCGPTVYGYTHVGNARAALTLDLCVRVLKLAGYKTRVARNYTDVDDKIIQKAHEECLSAQEIAKKYEQAYAEELKRLHSLEPDLTPRATEHIQDMLKMIEALIESSSAYVLESDFGKDVYFKVESFKGYGKLSKRQLEDMMSGTRVEANQDKKHPADFALWKAAKVGEPAWDSPWGKGRPGWHIECSAMIESLFQGQVDIHMGGIDLIFPHHENEIAQCESYRKRELARFWIHNGMIEMNQEKMSKSLGNIMRTHEFLELYGPECLRLMVLNHHYRSPIDFSEENILRAEQLLRRLYLAKAEAAEAKATEDPELEKKIKAALFDDFNSAKALGHILAATRTAFRKTDKKGWTTALKFLTEIFAVCEDEPKRALAAIRERRLKRMGLSEEREKEIEALVQERSKLRAEKRFEEADKIRDQLERENVLVMDGPEGCHWSVKA